MANRLREWIQNDVITPLGNKLGLTGTMNASDVKTNIESIITDTNGAAMIKYLITGQNAPDPIIIPPGITFVGRLAFKKIPAKRKVIVPTTITNFETKAFSNEYSSNYFDLYYQGTLQEYFNIIKNFTTDGSFVDGYYNLYINNNKIDDIVVNWSANFNNNSSFANLTANSVRFTNSVINLNSRLCAYSSIEEIILDENSNITTLPNYVFSDIGSRSAATDKHYTKKITLNSNLASTGTHTFYRSHIGEVVLPNNLQTIGEACFRDCKLDNKTINIPSTVTSISYYAFDTYDNGYTIIFNSTTPPTIVNPYDLFNTNGLKIYVPVGTLNTYKTHTNLTNYANYMIEKNSIQLNIPNDLLNNDQYTYSVDNGVTWLEFNESSITLNEIANIRFKNTNPNVTIKIGTSNGGSEIGTIANAELNYDTVGSFTIYLTIQ